MAESLLERVDRLEGELRRVTRLQRSQLWGVLALGALLVVTGGFYAKHLSATTHRTEANTRKIGLAQKVAASALAKNEAEQGALRSFEIGACKRSNQFRVNENRSSYADYRFFTTTATLIAASLANPPQPQTPAEAQQAAHFIGLLEGYAADKEWGHLIENCPLAVDHPTRYRLPPTVPFVKKLPPPGALHRAPSE